jgi:hypothetical protein
VALLLGDTNAASACTTLCEPSLADVLRGWAS